jgi:hypothetical protein
MTCRKSIGGIRTGVDKMPRDEPGGSLLTGQVVSGMKVARARFGLRCGTWEPVAPCPRMSSGASAWPALVRGSENPEQQICEGESSDAGHRGGPSRSSDEGPVMGLERRGWVVLAGLAANHFRVGGVG